MREGSFRREDSGIASEEVGASAAEPAVSTPSASSGDVDPFLLPAGVVVEWGRHRRAGEPARIGSTTIRTPTLADACRSCSRALSAMNSFSGLEGAITCIGG